MKSFSKLVASLVLSASVATVSVASERSQQQQQNPAQQEVQQATQGKVQTEEKKCTRDLAHIFGCTFSFLGKKVFAKWVWKGFFVNVAYDKFVNPVLYKAVWRTALVKGVWEYGLKKGAWNGYIKPVFVEGIGEEIIVNAFGKKVLIDWTYGKLMKDWAYGKVLKPTGLFIAGVESDDETTPVTPVQQQQQTPRQVSTVIVPVAAVEFEGEVYTIYGEEDAEVVAELEALELPIHAVPFYRVDSEEDFTAVATQFAGENFEINAL